MLNQLLERSFVYRREINISKFQLIRCQIDTFPCVTFIQLMDENATDAEEMQPSYVSLPICTIFPPPKGTRKKKCGK